MACYVFVIGGPPSPRTTEVASEVADVVAGEVADEVGAVASACARCSGRRATGGS